MTQPTNNLPLPEGIREIRIGDVIRFADMESEELATPVIDATVEGFRMISGQILVRVRSRFRPERVYDVPASWIIETPEN